MEQQITLTLSDTVLNRAVSLARLLARSVEEVLAKTLEITLPDVGSGTFLFQSYQRLWLRQSEALAEAVRRGLREPLSA